VIVSIPLAVEKFIIEWIVEAIAPKFLRPICLNITLEEEWLLMTANSIGIVQSLSGSPIVTLRVMVLIGHFDDGSEPNMFSLFKLYAAYAFMSAFVIEMSGPRMAPNVERSFFIYLVLIYYEVMPLVTIPLEKDSETSKNKKEKYKSQALKEKKVSSDEEVSCSGSSDEEYAMAVRDFKKFIKRRGKYVRQPHDDKNNFRRVKEENKGKEKRRFFKCGDLNHFISDCPKLSFNDQKAFVGGCWSDSEEEDDSKKDEKFVS
nr:zf-CCHC domain-containing protein [Tanacetum cinerariifolium]